MSRRALVTRVGAAGFAGLAGGIAAGLTAGGYARQEPGDEPALAPARAATGSGPGPVPALAVPTPAHVHIVAVDLRADSAAAARAAARATLTAWRESAADLHERGLASLGPGAPSAGLHPASLGVTLGVGPGLLERAGRSGNRPPELDDLPAFAPDDLDPAWCGGDLLLHAGAEDAVVLSAAVQYLLGRVREHARVRWSLPGFQRSAAAAVDPAATPRNLMGQVDGTVNPEPSDALFGTHVLASHPDRATAWMDGGSYVVIRRIRMLLDDWYALEPEAREAVIGRRLSDGAPLGGANEDDRPDLTAVDGAGHRVIPDTAHIRLAGPERTLGARMLRRGFNFDLGWGADDRREAGLIFTAWQADPRSAFTAVQEALDRGGDALAPFIRHEGSAVFAVPPVSGDRPHPAASLW
ncbi:Dyp-type peroxidase [Nocardiopsis mangrovi]|uniref:Dyp-type peroxidase n=1 Tax=Nocardiopsis mangrovi TaxID=1179818 RepID=A0ABV9DUN1_9ACTN